MRLRSEIWHVTWVMSVLSGGEKKFSMKSISMSLYAKHTTTCQNWINHHFGQINYERNFSIVNDHWSPSDFLGFSRDCNQTKMTHSWVGLMIFRCLFHSGFECDISVT